MLFLFFYFYLFHHQDGVELKHGIAGWPAAMAYTYYAICPPAGCGFGVCSKGECNCKGTLYEGENCTTPIRPVRLPVSMPGLVLGEGVPYTGARFTAIEGSPEIVWTLSPQSGQYPGYVELHAWASLCVPGCSSSIVVRGPARLSIIVFAWLLFQYCHSLFHGMCTWYIS